MTQSDRDKQRQTDTDRHKMTHSDRDKQRQIDTDRLRTEQSDRDKQRQTDIENQLDQFKAGSERIDGN